MHLDLRMDLLFGLKNNWFFDFRQLIIFETVINTIVINKKGVFYSFFLCLLEKKSSFFSVT